MWNRKQVKKQAKKILKNNIWTLIAIGLFMTIVFGKNIINTDAYTNLQLMADYFTEKNSTEILTDIQNKALVDEYAQKAVSQIFTGNMTNFINDYNEKHNVTKGVFFGIFQIFTKGKVQLQNFGNSFANYRDKELATSIFLIIASIFALCLEIFISFPIQIGECRIYLESKNYRKTKLKRIAYAFKKGRYLSSVKSVFLMELYLFLWRLTIVGGIIKSYSYRMVKYIIAENPTIDAKEAIKISREMMNGNKWDTFKLDLSFIGWTFLQFITFGLAGVYVSPYYAATNTELYTELRKDYKEKQKYNFELLNDDRLFEDNNLEQYPEIIEEKERKFKIDYNKKYEISSIILFFFIFSFIGWVWEVGLFVFTEGKLINRGALYGPWLPIYGTGCTLIVLLTKFKSFRRAIKNPLLAFFIVMILCTIIEYLTSWFIEMKTGVRYWDYTGIFLNLNGRVCLESSTFFGLGGCLCLYFAAPYLEMNLQKISSPVKMILCIVLVATISIDTIISQIYPHVGDGITSEKSVGEEIQERICKTSFQEQNY